MPRGKKKPVAKIAVTWKKSAIGYAKDQKATIKALGFKKMQQTLEVNDTPVIRGMLNKVKHLVQVNEAAKPAAKGGAEDEA